MFSNSKKIFLSVCLSASLVLGMTGCGKKEVQEESAILYSEEESFIASSLESVNTGMSFWYGKGCGKVLLPVEKDDDTNEDINSVKEIALLDISDGTIETKKLAYSKEGNEDLTLNRENILLGAGLLEDGSIRGVLKTLEDGNIKDLSLIEFDTDGEEVNRIDIRDKADNLTKSGSNHYIRAYINENGNAYIYSFGESDTLILGFDKEGEKLFETNVAGFVSNVDTLDEDELVFFSESGNCGLYKMSALTGEIQLIFNPPVDSSCRGLCVDNENSAVYFTFADQLFKYDLKEKTNEAVVRLSEMEIISDNVMGLAYKGDDSFYILNNEVTEKSYETEVYLASKGEALEDTREVITICVFEENDASEMRNLAVGYNKKSKDFKIEVLEYEASDFDGVDERFTMDIAAGNIPDIIDISSINTIELIKSGVLCDLNPLLDNDSEMSRDDFLKGSLDTYSVGDGLYAIPTVVSVCTLVGPKSTFGDCIGWDLDKFKDKLELGDNNEITCINASRTEIYARLMIGQLNRFVDIEKGTCNFDSEEFRELLEFSMRFPEDTGDSDDDDNTLNLVREGKVKLRPENANTPLSFLIDKMIFSEDICYVGYPSDNQKGTSLQTLSGVYAISEKCENKEAAWDFVKYLIKNTDWSSSFPTYLESLDKALESAKIPMYSLDDNGEKVEKPMFTIDMGDISLDVYAATEDDIKDMREMLENAEPASINDFRIWLILYEEVEGFLKGNKTMDDTVNVIQNRVSVYLNEQG